MKLWAFKTNLTEVILKSWSLLLACRALKVDLAAAALVATARLTLQGCNERDSAFQPWTWCASWLVQMALPSAWEETQFYHETLHKVSFEKDLLELKGTEKSRLNQSAVIAIVSFCCSSVSALNLWTLAAAIISCTASGFTLWRVPEVVSVDLSPFGVVRWHEPHELLVLLVLLVVLLGWDQFKCVCV